MFGGTEKFANDAVMQFDHFVGDGGHAFNDHRHQGGIAALRLKLGNIGGLHLPAFTRHFEESVLVDQSVGLRAG